VVSGTVSCCAFFDVSIVQYDNIFYVLAELLFLPLQ